ncbi:hypothetical protein BB560_006818 [Smittium megazygosporum]|uniref:cysteine--tRNA ligase n=1 Tax=Smittium megazygosporum TaxID=133381 RepID=A0A2T9Y191_9FUNG|nr:hypothetical protein BB560_006818 [Smittium megazygosporum]
MTETPKKLSPTWTPVNPEEAAPSLSIYNSLTKSKVPFVPISGNNVSWYGCGPTVYDAAHLGHARNYVTFDFIRRILQNYFGYDLNVVMNITDIDDKIILRGRQAHLFSEKKKNTSTLNKALIEETVEAWKEYAESMLKLSPTEFSSSNLEDWKIPLLELQTKNLGLEQNPKLSMYLRTSLTGIDAIARAEKNLAEGKSSHDSVGDLLNGNEEIVSLYLDKRFGSDVTEPSIFRTLTQFWEKDFMEDMEALNVLKPDVLVRVTEFIPEIVSFVQKIIDNGYAYESNGSVYFSVNEFDGKNGHFYAKLEPTSKGNQDLLNEGEGSLSIGLSGKKHPADFALWKASKPGEPAWESPWGKGRPGWHIECSVMASEVLGDKIDIHTGGIDLTFPHHDNELAQSEAHFENHQWVNYFMHAGHLHIEGSKMSKSLKNFISIKDALKKYTARQLRLCFLMQRWDAPFDFKASFMEEALSTESTISNFFINIESLSRQWNSDEATFGEGGVRTFCEDEVNLVKELNQAQKKIHSALCDSFDTPSVLKTILSLINKSNIYLRNKTKVSNSNAIMMVARYVSSVLRTFGLNDPTSNVSEIGWNPVSSSSLKPTSTSALQNESVVMPYLNIISQFRDVVRLIAKKDEISKAELLKACDVIRDVQLPKYGVILDDHDEKSLIKLVDPEVLALEAEKKAKLAEEKRLKTLAMKEAAAKKQQARLEAGKLNPSEMFKTATRAAEFSEWDENGIPTKDSEGQEITKNKKKKLQKEYDNQKKLHEEYLKSIQS